MQSPHTCENDWPQKDKITSVGEKPWREKETLVAVAWDANCFRLTMENNIEVGRKFK